MSTVTHYSSYDQERTRRRAQWEQAPKRCPHCAEPINQQYSEYGNNNARSHCGATNCRASAYRQRKANRLQAARQDADARVKGYAAHLPAEQAVAVQAMHAVLMGYGASRLHGHEQTLAIIDVIEAQRCKHDRIAVLLDHASAAQRRADQAEACNAELTRLYERRIAELQAELSVYQLLESAVHNIATRQLLIQPDPQEQPTPVPEPEDADRARVLASLAQAGIRPYTSQQEDKENEDRESREYEEDEEDEEEE